MFKSRAQLVVLTCLALAAIVAASAPPLGKPVQAAAAPQKKKKPRAPVYIPGQYIVEFHEGVKDPTAEAGKFAQAGVAVSHVYDDLKGFAARIPDHLVSAVRQDPRVASVERDQVVSIDQAAGPDLVITNVAVSTTVAKPGDVITVDVTVQNNGTTASGLSNVSIYKDLANAPTPTTPKDDTKQVLALAPGASTVITFNFSYGNAGFKTFRALADSKDKNAETAENNNAGGPVAISASSQFIGTGIERIEATQSFAMSGDLQGSVNNVTVAVIDTGIDLEYTKELNVTRQKNFVSSGPTTNDADDKNGHGTHVAGIVGAKDNLTGAVGVAPGVNLWAIKVLNDLGFGSTSDVIAGINYVTKNAPDVDVANLSLGGSRSNSLNKAVRKCVTAGVVCVVAAGNNGVDADTESPSSETSALVVADMVDTDGLPGGLGASTSFGADDTFASFSNWSDDPTIVDCIAPGVRIKSTFRNQSNATLSGTSQAAPHVAGLAALYLSRNPNDTPAQVRTAILNGASEQIAGINGETRTYPLINAKNTAP